jgi:hypothetical protein
MHHSTIRYRQRSINLSWRLRRHHEIRTVVLVSCCLNISWRL